MCTVGVAARRMTTRDLGAGKARWASLAGLEPVPAARVLQGTGPDSSTAAAVADYNLAHRSTLLANEVAVALALLAFIPFLAALVPIIWRAGQETHAVAVAVSGGVCVWPWALCPTLPKLT